MGSELTTANAGRADAPPAPGEKLRHLFHSVTFAFLGLLLIYLIYSFAIPFRSSVNPAVWRIQVTAIADVALLLESWLFLAAVDGREFHSLGLSFRPGWSKQFSAGLGAGAALMATVTIVLVAVHAVQYTGLARTSRAATGPLAATALFIFFAAALEEIGFRGYAFQRLIDATGAFGAVAITSFLFGLGHLSNPSATPLSVANTALAGIVMALGYLRTKGLWFPIGLHFAWNFVLGSIASLPVSGLGLVSLFNVRVIGPVWLTGGDYGPEGSVILTVVCLGGITLLARGSGIVTFRRAEDAVE
jgi:membrane protease YdiL (CAAX protease family)